MFPLTLTVLRRDYSRVTVLSRDYSRGYYNPDEGLFV